MNFYLGLFLKTSPHPQEAMAKLSLMAQFDDLARMSQQLFNPEEDYDSKNNYFLRFIFLIFYFLALIDVLGKTENIRIKWLTSERKLLEMSKENKVLRDRVNEQELKLKHLRRNIDTEMK